jgi:hypothetical protein
MISAALYKQMSDNLASFQHEASLSVDHLKDVYDILQELKEANVGLPLFISGFSLFVERLEDSFLSEISSPRSEINEAVTSLQRHVTIRANSVDSFLSSNGVKVQQDFADLSLAVGYKISSNNIES